MEINDLIEQIDFSTTGKELKQGIESEEDMKKMLEDYYINDLTQKEVAKIYKINNMWFMRNEFPKIYSQENCKYCNEPMYYKFPPKNIIKSLTVTLEPSKCIKCEHLNKVDCSCKKCEEAIRNKIIETYDFDEPIPISDLFLEDYLSVATLMQGYYLEEDDLVIPSIYSQNIDSKEKSNLFGSLDNLYTEIEKLYNKNILKVAPTSSISSFVPKSRTEKFPNRFYIYYVDYTFKNLKLNFDSDEEWINKFKYPVFNTSNLEDNSVVALWKEIVINELTKIFDYHAIKQHHFSYPKDVDSRKEMLSLLRDSIFNWLSIYTPAETYSIIFAGIGRAVSLRSQYGMKHKNSEIKYLITAINTWLENNKNKDNKIIPYDYPADIEVSLRTRIFFNQLLGVENWFGSRVPKKKAIENTQKYNLTTQELTQHLKFAISYTVTEFGVVIEYDREDTSILSKEYMLFSTEELFRKWVNKVPFNESILELINMEHVTTEHPYYMTLFDSLFKIEDHYSTEYLFSLISKLQQTKVPLSESEEMDKEIKRIRSFLSD